MTPNQTDSVRAAIPEDPRIREIERIDRVARLLDARFPIPGTRLRFGLDSIVGLIPGVGDLATAVPSTWMLWRGWKHGIPKRSLARMGANIGIDLAVGSIPLVGDLFDLGFKSNLRNADILRTELRRPHDGGPPAE